MVGRIVMKLPDVLDQTLNLITSQLRSESGHVIFSRNDTLRQYCRRFLLDFFAAQIRRMEAFPYGGSRAICRVAHGAVLFIRFPCRICIRSSLGTGDQACRLYPDCNKCHELQSAIRFDHRNPAKSFLFSQIKKHWHVDGRQTCQ